MAQTIVEKIAQSHMSEGPNRPLRAGDFLSIRPYHVMTHDNTSAVMKKFKAIGADASSRSRAAGLHCRSRHSEHGRVEPGEVPQHGGLRARAWHRLLSAGHGHRSPDHGGERLRAAGNVSSSPPIRTPTCTERWARLARLWFAPTRLPSGQPANSGGRFRVPCRWFSKASWRRASPAKTSSSLCAACTTRKKS